MWGVFICIYRVWQRSLDSRGNMLKIEYQLTYAPCGAVGDFMVDNVCDVVPTN